MVVLAAVVVAGIGTIYVTPLVRDGSQVVCRPSSLCGFTNKSSKLTRECFNFRLAFRLETYTIRKSAKSYGRNRFYFLPNDPR